MLRVSPREQLAFKWLNEVGSWSSLCLVGGEVTAGQHGQTDQLLHIYCWLSPLLTDLASSFLI